MVDACTNNETKVIKIDILLHYPKDKGLRCVLNWVTLAYFSRSRRSNCVLLYLVNILTNIKAAVMKRCIIFHYYEGCGGLRDGWPGPTCQDHRGQIVYFCFSQNIEKYWSYSHPDSLPFMYPLCGMHRGDLSWPTCQDHRGQIVNFGSWPICQIFKLGSTINVASCFTILRTEVKDLANIKSWGKNLFIILYYHEDWVMSIGWWPWLAFQDHRGRCVVWFLVNSSTVEVEASIIKL